MMSTVNVKKLVCSMKNDKALKAAGLTKAKLTDRIEIISRTDFSTRVFYRNSNNKNQVGIYDIGNPIT